MSGGCALWWDKSLTRLWLELEEQWIFIGERGRAAVVALKAQTQRVLNAENRRRVECGVPSIFE